VEGTARLANQEAQGRSSTLAWFLGFKTRSLSILLIIIKQARFISIMVMDLNPLFELFQFSLLL